jgi:hypothetical protein
VAADAPAVLLEANFWPDDPRHGERARALASAPVVVNWYGPYDYCLRSLAARAASRHPVHVDLHALRDLQESFARSSGPLGLGEVITVDTSRPVDVAALAVQVRRLLPGTSKPR